MPSFAKPGSISRNSDMPEFKNVLREFAQDIKRNFRSRIATQPEDQLKPGVQRVLQAAARQIQTRTEAHAADVRSPVFFMHIMKTGGTALGTALAHLNDGAHAGASVTGIFLDQFVLRDPRQWGEVGFVTGHLPWEARELLPPATRTLTVFRDPVDRSLSHYWQLSTNPDVQAESPGFTLEEYVESPRWNTLCRDYQARQLAHRVDLANAGKSYAPAERFASLGPPFPPEHQYPLQSLFDCSPLALTGDDLERVALRSLSEIEFVGVTEHLDALYREVAERVWSVDDPPVLERENPSHDRPRRATVSVELVRRIEEMTVVDHALYEEARRRAPSGRGA